MRHLFILPVLFLSLASVAQQKIMGFTDANATKQKDLEKQFDAQLKAENLDTWMKYLTSHPHHVGSPQGKANAEYMANLFKQWGYDTEIKTYYVLFPTPKTRVLKLQGSKPFKAKLEEPTLPNDPYTAQKAEQLPTYNAYSADGNVTAPLVYVNRGVPADYEELERMGVDVKGKIVIAKYGGSWRGIKPKVAYEHGAVGCLIYSDPADDGYGVGDVYTEGSFRPEQGVQRGSVMDMPVYPGDPTTPGYASTKDAKRLDLKDVQTIMKIPVIPISYADALPLLESMGGEAVPPSWRGGLPITYHVGPGNAPVHLQLAFNWDIKPLYNVVATMKGTDYPDEWVIRGNHHDGWVNGAEDPISGMVAEMEEARAIGELAKKGMRPKRTIMYCAWDGEEPALLGSTEWAEDNAKELQKKAVIYINSDGNGRGFIGASGSHTLEPMFNEIIGDVIDPQTGVTVKQRRYASDLVNADRSRREKLLSDKTFKLGALGAGSDYSPFIQHLGIASMNLGYGGEDPAGVYHSIYDNYNHYTKFGDPGFQYGVALAKTAGRMTLRMANADVLPLDLTSFTKTVNDYATEVKTLLDNTRTETEQQNRMLRESVYKVAADPKKNHVLPKEKETVPYLNFSPLENSIAELKQKAEEFQKLYSTATSLSAEQRKQFNEVLMKIEQSLISEAGLPRRPWYKHEIYAPGFYTGYGVKTLPMIREAIEQRNWKEAQQGIDIVGTTIKTYTAEVEKASGMLKKTL